MMFKLDYLLSFPCLDFYFWGFDSIFSLAPVLLEVSEDLWVCAIDTTFQ